MLPDCYRTKPDEADFVRTEPHRPGCGKCRNSGENARTGLSDAGWSSGSSRGS